MANRTYDYRRYSRYVKGIKRIKQDREEHGSPYRTNYKGEAVLSCDCFCPDATHGKGAIFARFADTPKYFKEGWDDWVNGRIIPTLETEDRDENGERNRSFGLTLMDSGGSDDPHSSSVKP